MSFHQTISHNSVHSTEQSPEQILLSREKAINLTYGIRRKTILDLYSPVFLSTLYMAQKIHVGFTIMSVKKRYGTEMVQPNFYFQHFEAHFSKNVIFTRRILYNSIRPAVFKRQNIFRRSITCFYIRVVPTIWPLLIPSRYISYGSKDVSFYM